MADHQEILGNFVAITDADEATALGILEAANWNLEQAVELHFSTQGDAPAGGAAVSHNADEQLARQLAQEAGPQEDEVRAPMPTKTERLYGDDMMFMPRRAARPTAQRHQVAAFGDFRPEGGDNQASGSGGQAGLADLFKPPADLLYMADFEVAKHKAAKDGKWLLVNVQSHAEFASHQLNRDTWSNSVVKALLQEQFIFWQTNEDTEDGQKVSTYYRLVVFPSVLIIDPITGAKMYHKTGFIDAEKLLEELVPFMDHGPKDAGAVLLAQASMQRGRTPASSSVPAAPSSSTAAAMTEDEELARAIAMSMQDNGDGGTGGQPEEEAEEEEMEEDVAAATTTTTAPTKRSAEEVRQEILQRLPAEPAAGQPSCRVAVRCPNGQRMQRHFSPQDTVQALMDFCAVEVPEAASGRTFQLVPSYPGATPVDDVTQTLQQAGVANSMLAMKWVD